MLISFPSGDLDSALGVELIFVIDVESEITLFDLLSTFDGNFRFIASDGIELSPVSLISFLQLVSLVWSAPWVSWQQADLILRQWISVLLCSCQGLPDCLIHKSCH